MKTMQDSRLFTLLLLIGVMGFLLLLGNRPAATLDNARQAQAVSLQNAGAAGNHGGQAR
jgi:hypothetical protein